MVVFPAPERPTMATVWPVGTSMETLARAWGSPSAYVNATLPNWTEGLAVPPSP